MSDTFKLKIFKYEDVEKKLPYFVEVPQFLYNRALEEKKSWSTLTSWAFAYQRGSLKELNKLYMFIFREVGFEISIDIERIKNNL